MEKTFIAHKGDECIKLLCRHFYFGSERKRNDTIRNADIHLKLKVISLECD